MADIQSSLYDGLVELVKNIQILGEKHLAEEDEKKIANIFEKPQLIASFKIVRELLKKYEYNDPGLEDVPIIPAEYFKLATMINKIQSKLDKEPHSIHMGLKCLVIDSQLKRCCDTWDEIRTVVDKMIIQWRTAAAFIREKLRKGEVKHSIYELEVELCVWLKEMGADWKKKGASWDDRSIEYISPNGDEYVEVSHPRLTDYMRAYGFKRDKYGTVKYSCEILNRYVDRANMRTSISQNLRSVKRKTYIDRVDESSLTESAESDSDEDENGNLKDFIVPDNKVEFDNRDEKYENLYKK
jgi:hypothetical protein